MKLYTNEGWLDVPHVVEIADRNNINFIVIIGKRQIGKTYNVLMYMLDYDKRFVFMRRVKPEIQMLEKGVNSPFEKLKKYADRVSFIHESEYSSRLVRIDETDDGDVETQIGLGCALSVVGKLRGFNGDLYTDVVFDEFIPEEHLYKVRNEGNAFKAAHETINGNRELEGRPCLRWWLLANSNDLDNEILNSLHITEIVEKMSLRGEEARVLPDRGIMILLPDSEVITEKRAKTGLYRAIGTDDDYAKMALGNEFAFNDYSDVYTQPIKEYNLIVTVGSVSIYLHKDRKNIYITTKANEKARHMYAPSEYGYKTFVREYPEIKAAYMRGKTVFQTMAVKNAFKNIVEKF